MNSFELPFIPGSNRPSVFPLARFLPPVPAGMVENWLKRNLSSESWIIDPLGSSPLFDLEAAQAGYRVFVTCVNPILSFMLETIAKAPSRNDFQAALSELATARLGNERLETHLQSLYQTECSACGNTIQAQAFLWKKQEMQPFARQYRCPYCGDEGERLMGEKDLQRLELLTKSAGLHHARATERVRVDNAQAMTTAQEALKTYLPRSIYFLFTLINKVEGLPLTEERRNLLTALLITACDAGNNLWAWPNPRTRPRQLSTPPQFRENNLWLTIENASSEWNILSNAIPVTHWPELPPSEGGICLYNGRIKTLEQLPGITQASTTAVVIPRPNQAFWTLCALWSGWLWGQKALSALRSALIRKRYDWHWFTYALYNNLLYLRRATNNAENKLLAIMPELTPGFFSATLLATEAAGFHLQDIAFEPDQAIAQGVWSFKKQQPPYIESTFSRSKEIMRDYLIKINQPATYLQLHVASLSQIASKFGLPSLQSQPKPELIGKIQTEFENALINSTYFTHLRGQSEQIKSGTWWLKKADEMKELPLYDRAEIELVRFLNNNPGGTFQEIYTSLCERLPGLLTPALSFVQACLESYAIPKQENKDYWVIRSAETVTNRRMDIVDIQGKLIRLGQRLGFYTQQHQESILWLNSSNQPIYTFFVIASSIVSRFVLRPNCTLPTQFVLVFPGSRSNLLAYKLQHDPRLVNAIQNGWHFLKFRHLRAIAERMGPTLEMWQSLLDQDPPVWQEPSQMALF